MLTGSFAAGTARRAIRTDTEEMDMARREWSPSDPVIRRAADSAVVAIRAIAKHAVGAETSPEEAELDRLAGEARRERGE